MNALCLETISPRDKENRIHVQNRAFFGRKMFRSRPVFCVLRFNLPVTIENRLIRIRRDPFAAVRNAISSAAAYDLLHR
jgi:hypothetical protein